MGVAATFTHVVTVAHVLFTVPGVNDSEFDFNSSDGFVSAPWNSLLDSPVKKLLLKLSCFELSATWGYFSVAL